MTASVQWGRGPKKKKTESKIFFSKLHKLILVTSDWHNQGSLPPAWIIILLYLCLCLVSSFRWDLMSPVLAPGKHLTMVDGVSLIPHFWLWNCQLPGSASQWVLLSRENLLETRAGWWCPLGFILELCFLWTVTQSARDPSCVCLVGGHLDCSARASTIYWILDSAKPGL